MNIYFTKQGILMLPRWEDSYSVDNEMIDSQHKKLFEIAKKAYLMVNHHVTREQIKEVLREFFEYMGSHFDDEEKYMASIDYPDLENHKILHAHIITNFSECVKTVQSANDLKEQIGIIAKDWLLQHILKEDMKIQAYCKDKLFVQKEIKGQVYEYYCACIGKIHEVPLEVHQKIKYKGVKFICRQCKQVIRSKK